LRSEGIEVTVQRLNRRLKDLRKQLQIVAMDQVAEVFRNNEDHIILESIKACSVSGDIDGVEQYIEKFREHAEHMQVCVTSIASEVIFTIIYRKCVVYFITFP
jgi:hypothetical protein